jgi:hypothetical protein
MAGETFQHIEFSNNSSPYISDTNLNEMQDNIDEAIQTTNTNLSEIKQEKKVRLSTAGWYRVGIIHSNGIWPNTIIMSVGTQYVYGPPSTALISIATTYRKAKISQLNAATEQNNRAITRVRVLYDSTDDCFYIDAYYNYTYTTEGQGNVFVVGNVSILKGIDTSVFELIEPIPETLTSTVVDDMLIDYNKVEPYYRYLDSFFINSWSGNGENLIEVDELGVKHITISVKNGTDRGVMQLPTELRPATTVLLSATNQIASGYISIDTAGKIGVSANIFTSGSSNLISSGTYK